MLEELFARYAATLHRYFMHKTGNPDLSSDLVQETFLRVLEKGKLSEVRKLDSFVFIVASNLLKDYAKQSFVRKQDSVDDHFFDSLEDQSTAPDTRTLQLDKLERLQQLLEQLPAQQRDTFILIRLEGWSYPEVAFHFRISQSKVAKDLAAASLFVSERLQDIGLDE